MKNKMKMRVISLLLCFVMLVGLVPTTVLAAEKNKISEFEATATLPDKLYVGMNLYDPNLLETISFNITKGTPAKLDAASPWMYYNEETGYYERIYKNDDEQIVKAGVRYAYAAQLRIDGVDYETNTLAQHVDVKINGVLWNTSEDPYASSTVTYTWTQSPDFEVSNEPYRQKIPRISATVYGYQNTYFYGDPIVLPSSYEVTAGIPAKFDDTTDVWQKKNGDTWEDCTENTFKGGTYRLKVKLVVDGEDNDTHYLNDGIWGAINGTTMSSRYWHSLGNPTHTANSSYVWMVSPEHVIEGPAAYTVTFDTNGGTMPGTNPVVVDSGEKVTKPAIDPTYAGHVFAGWYSDAGLTTPFDFANTVITGDTTIYAKWDVVITAANATVTVPVAGEHPDFNPISGDSSRYTVAFETWYLHESPYPDLDANSVFEHGKYYSLRIRFTPNAGYQFDSNTVFTVNEKATASFGGIGAREYSATAYAATYTVTYDANGGTGSMAQEFLTHDNDGFAKNYTFPQCGFTSPAGQEFDKWLWYYESNPGSTNEITPGQSPWIYGNIVVKALWKTAEYNVTVTGGTASVGAGTPITKATMGTIVTLIAGQAPAGQEFDKWVVNGVVVADANNATTTFVMPAGNVTATATYKNISVGNHPVTIAMKDGDDVNSAYTDVQNLALELLAYKGLLVEDAQVTGFRNNAGKLLFTMNNNFIVLQDGLTEQDYIHYTLTPQEVAEIKSYYGADITEVHLTFPSKCVVSFETNGGSSVSKLNLYIGDKVTKPADPTKPYFALAGWYSDSGLTQAFDFNQPITGDITLYAKWTPSPVGGMFLMTIDFNGGTSTMPTVGEVPANSGIYLNDNLGNFVTPPSGKVLAGYEIDGVPYAAGGDYLVTQNFTLKFLWKDAPVTTYTVSFAANGGTGTMADVNGVSGEYTLPENGFTAPDGKQFKAWSVGSVEKAVGDKITVTSDTTVTAVWETIPAGHTCDIKPAQKVEPSCTEGGKEAYYKCEGCGKFYEDALGVKEITDLAAWGNIAKNGHTESDWKSDKDNHWKECTVAACGVIIENSKAAHADANNDGKCDTCEYNVGTTTTNPNNKPSDDTTNPEDTNKPSDDVQSPQTGDNSMMWLWVALLFVSGLGVVATTVIGKKRTSAK